MHPFKGCENLADKDGFIILDINNKHTLCDCLVPITKQEVIIPDGVHIINDYALAEGYDDFGFRMANTYRKVVVPSSVERIGYRAFCEARKLQQVVLHEGLQIIEAEAFYDCESLKELYIPSSVTEIGSNIVGRCRYIVIYGKADTVAEKYAKDNNLEFIVSK